MSLALQLILQQHQATTSPQQIQLPVQQLLARLTLGHGCSLSIRLNPIHFHCLELEKQHHRPSLQIQEYLASCAKLPFWYLSNCSKCFDKYLLDYGLKKQSKVVEKWKLPLPKLAVQDFQHHQNFWLRPAPKVSGKECQRTMWLFLCGVNLLLQSVLDLIDFHFLLIQTKDLTFQYLSPSKRVR